MSFRPKQAKASLEAYDHNESSSLWTRTKDTLVLNFTNTDNLKALAIFAVAAVFIYKFASDFEPKAMAEQRHKMMQPS